MYKCIKCNKVFPTPSKLEVHKNRKNSCNEIKKKLECNICNVKFKCPFDQNKHENTTKHIYNIQQSNINNNVECDIKQAELNDKILILEKENNNLKTENNNLKTENNNLKTENNNLKIENNNLINQINILNISNQILKNNQKIHNSKEYIYILHCAQHINENIYKIGRTNNIIKRFNQYPKGSELLFTITCNNSKLIENNILDSLKNNSKYIHYKESGNEYFKCELEYLKMDIQNIINKYNEF